MIITITQYLTQDGQLTAVTLETPSIMITSSAKSVLDETTVFSRRLVRLMKEAVGQEEAA
jgi:hypothetical protein